MAPRSLEQITRVLVYDDEGAGRCHLGKYAIKRRLQDKLPNATFIAAGLRKPDSGRTTIHPAPAKAINSRYKMDVSNDPVHLLRAKDVNKHTIALGLTGTPPHNYLLRKAFDVLVAPTTDPFPNLASDLEAIAREISLVAWLFEWVLLNKFDELGQAREENGIIRPRMLVTFQPPVEAEYDLREPMNVRFHTDLDRPLEGWQVARLGKSW